MTDPAATARLDTLEKSLGGAAQRLANLRAQSDKLASAIND